MTPSADAIADCVLAAFEQLPDKRKPRPRSDGSREWVPLSGIVLSKGNTPPPAEQDSWLMLIVEQRRQALMRLSRVRSVHVWPRNSVQLPGPLLYLLLLAVTWTWFIASYTVASPPIDTDKLNRTGMKCLPQNKLAPANGIVLHDWHAEVLAIRTFNRFLLDECLQFSVSDSASASAVLHQRPNQDRTDQEPQPFTIREDVRIHMYCSEAPCGDASMELTMDAQQDATPWTSAPPTVTSEALPDSAGALRGRSNFSLLGAVRCKPSRPDAPPTLSKSCTDKLTMKQATSLLSSLTSTLVSPHNAYLHSLVLPASQHVPAACERAFSRTGRLRGLTDETIQSWRRGYRWHPFDVQPTKREFTWSRRSVAANEKSVASNLSAVWTPSWQETLIGGVLQGRKQMDPRGASKICSKSAWMLAVQIAGIAGAPAVLEALMKATYREFKDGTLLEARRKVKKEAQEHGLGGWVKNVGDSDFSLGTAPRS